MTGFHIVVAMKPTEGNFSQNAVKHGVAGLNIDGCRVRGVEKIMSHKKTDSAAKSKGRYGDYGGIETHQTTGQALGRFPANLILDLS